MRIDNSLERAQSLTGLKARSLYFVQERKGPYLVTSPTFLSSQATVLILLFDRQPNNLVETINDSVTERSASTLLCKAKVRQGRSNVSQYRRFQSSAGGIPRPETSPLGTPFYHIRFITKYTQVRGIVSLQEAG